MKRVFLGGTCNGSDWRRELISRLKIDYFNPIVADWNKEAQEREIKERGECDFCLYVITSDMVGVYSIAEAVDDSNKRPEKCVFCFISEGFRTEQIKSLMAVGNLIWSNGGKFCRTLEEVWEYLNEQA